MGEIAVMYRQILRLAKKFPSVKRDQLVKDIRAEFNDNKILTNPQEVEEKVLIAQRGIRQLGMYVNLDPKKSNWTVEMEKDPLGDGSKSKPRQAAETSSPSSRITTGEDIPVVVVRR